MSKLYGNNSKKKMSIVKKVAITFLCIFILLIASVVGVGYWGVNSMVEKMESVELEAETPEELGITPEVEEKFGEIRNIALFGIDAPDGKTGRSDAIMILTLDSIHNKMKLTSIMRDSYVEIPGRGLDKINHAYAFGGPELAIRTLNENFNLNIKDFVAVNFTSLPAIINKVGGVDINIISEEIQHISGVKSTGVQSLNGDQALAYARIRYATGGDYKRTERQRTVINAVFNKLKNTPISQYPSLISDFLPFIKTNISSSDILSLGTNFSRLISGGLQQDRFPRDGQGAGEMIGGIYYLTFDKEAIRDSIYDYIFEDK